MSDLFKEHPLYDSKECQALSAKTQTQKIKTHTAIIGDHLTIRRALPHRDRKTIGAWCFLDHFGPLDLANTQGLHIGPHPHIGLQTFTYPLAGEILHRDSLGSVQKIQPGQVNLMTAGQGISHSEESLPDTVLHGVQLWIALPDSARHMPPNFIHYDTVPSFDIDGLQLNLLAGEYKGHVSPVKVYSPLMGLEMNATEDVTTVLPLNPHFEYGVLPLIGNVEILHEAMDIETLLYLPCGQSHLPMKIPKGSCVLLLGGEPLDEEILIWWNFVARTKNEIIQATNDWNNQQRFGEVKGYQGARLSAPPVL